MKRLLVYLLLSFSALAVSGAEPWPGAAWQSAEVLTHLDPHFKNNMSGACWNPVSRSFWVCCNGGPSAFWALRKNKAGKMAIAVDSAGKQAKYNLGSGDLEGICQVDYKQKLVCVILEGADIIKEFDVSVHGKAVLKNQWKISEHVPTKGGSGSEGITFVPNEWLRKGGFMDGGGKPYLARGDMGGLMFVAHQNGGRVYAFDLDRKSGKMFFVGAYKTSRGESSGLEFDRSSGLLYVWHNTGPNYMEITKLSSRAEGKERRLVTAVEYLGPKKGNLEGLAVNSTDSKSKRFLIVDDNNHNGAALMLFK